MTKTAGYGKNRVLAGIYLKKDEFSQLFAPD
jgi:hypothetical protein